MIRNDDDYQQGERRRPPSDSLTRMDTDTYEFMLSRLKNQNDLLEKIIFFFFEYYCSCRGVGLREFVETMEKVIISRVLERFDGQQRAAARFLRVIPTTLNGKIKRLQKKDNQASFKYDLSETS